MCGGELKVRPGPWNVFVQGVNGLQLKKYRGQEFGNGAWLAYCRVCDVKSLQAAVQYSVRPVDLDIGDDHSRKRYVVLADGGSGLRTHIDPRGLREREYNTAEAAEWPENLSPNRVDVPLVGGYCRGIPITPLYRVSGAKTGTFPKMRKECRGVLHGLGLKGCKSRKGSAFGRRLERGNGCCRGHQPQRVEAGKLNYVGKRCAIEASHDVGIEEPASKKWIGVDCGGC
ncbi:hypothetical protein DFH09DRAFT_1092477 [Mycena vulgaris]|nr:hypothetical protein DFH09DRAFT_1092477 [Mycena vulgaris]